MAESCFEILSNAMPSSVQVESDKDFILDVKGSCCLFVYGLEIFGDENVILGKTAKSEILLHNVNHNISSVRWLDNNEKLQFTQNTATGSVMVYPTGYPYGTDLVVRIAEIVKESW